MKLRRTISDLPLFTVTQSSSSHLANGVTDYELTGTFDIVQNVKTGRAWLLQDGRVALIGDLVNLDLNTRTAVFSLCEKADLDFAGKSFRYLDGYWQAYHVWMVTEPDWQWTKKLFQAEDAVVERQKIDSEQWFVTRKRTVDDVPGEDTPSVLSRNDISSRGIITGGWDHEHCELCCEPIEPGQFGYLDAEGHWLCGNCYTAFVIPHDLSFIENG